MPDIACIGRYWPGDSPIHRMDARAKLLLSLAVMAIAFVAQTFAALGVVALFTVALFALSGIPLKSALRSIVPLLFIVVITALLNVLFVHTGDVVFQWWVIEVTTGGIRMAVFIALRLTVLLLAMSLLTLTTPTLDITDAFEYLLAPFRRFGLPAHELSMMMGLALRFMPLFVGELTTIYRAQVSRGAPAPPARGPKAPGSSDRRPHPGIPWGRTAGSPGTGTPAPPCRGTPGPTACPPSLARLRARTLP